MIPNQPVLYLRAPRFGEEGLLDDYVHELARSFQRNPAYRAKHTDWKNTEITRSRARQLLTSCLQQRDLQVGYDPQETASYLYGNTGDIAELVRRTEAINAELAKHGIRLLTRSNARDLASLE